MKSFHEFFGIESPVALEEELNDYQKKIVDKMYVGRAAKTDHDAAFGAGNDKIVLPFDHVDETISTDNPRSYDGLHHTKKIIDSLASQGYKTDDYHSGLAYHKDTPNRKIKIGKALEASGIADIHTHFSNKKGEQMTHSQVYAADPSRSAQGEKQIVITRNPHDVCGMSSGRGWTSCMQMPKFSGDSDKGVNQHYLKHDIENGTLTAYLTKKGDDELKSPIGRVNLKQFQNDGHHIYRPEASTYGSMSASTKDALKGAVGDWSEKTYESKPGIYLKNPSLYNDDGNSIKMEKPIEAGTDAGSTFSMIRNAVRDANRAGLEHADIRAYKHDDYEAVSNHEESMKSLVGKLHNQLPPKEQALHTIHSLISNAEDHDGDGTERHYQDIDTSEKSAYDYMHEHALNRANSTNSNRGVVEDFHQMEKMPSHEAFALHKKIDATIKNTRNPEEHSELKDYHSGLIDNIMRKGSEQEKNETLHDMIGATGEHAEYYKDMNENHDSIFDDHHPATLTTNPRTIHSLMTNTNEAIPQAESFKDSDVAQHIGKHTDEKLAHELTHGELAHHFDSDWSVGSNGKAYAHGNGVHEDFIHGLNANPHGEHIQHSLTSEMLLTGGHSPDQRTTLDVNPVHNYTKTRVAPTASHGGGERLDKKAGRPSVPYSETEASDGDRQLEAYKDIAQHSKFRSVVSKLKNREDTQHPEILDAIKNNDHGLHEEVRLISLRQFLAESSPGFEIPNERKGLNKSRYRMPQVKADDIKSDGNLKTTEKTVRTSDLIPTQGQFNWDKVKGIAATGKPQGGVVVSSDNYVIDGHHRFLAGHAINGQVGVVQVNKPAEELIDYLKDAPYAQFKKLYEAKSEKDVKKKKEKSAKIEPTEIVTEPQEDDLLTAGGEK
jgi:hypothetical protein